jgi:hypothetical protein
MSVIVTFLRRTWLATTLFVVTSVAIWWKWLDWKAAQEHLPPTLLLAPVFWWALVARKRRPAPLRGLVAGALIGAVTQILPHVRFLWPYLSHPRAGDGDDQAASFAVVGVSLMIASCALVIGAVVGLLAVAIQRHTEASVDDLGSAPPAPPNPGARSEGSHRAA